jgi:hypothetical protein
MRGFWEFFGDVYFWLVFIAIVIPLLVIGWRVIVIVGWMLLAALLYPIDRILMLVSPSYRGRNSDKPAGEASAPRRMTLDALGKAQRSRIERRLAKAKKRAASMPGRRD